MTISLTHLQALICLCDQRSDDRLSVAVLTSIRELETLIGADLFDRSGGKLQPTMLAKQLLPRARLAAAELEATNHRKH